MVISFVLASSINSRNESAVSRLHFVERENEKLLGEHFIFHIFAAIRASINDFFECSLKDVDPFFFFFFGSQNGVGITYLLFSFTMSMIQDVAFIFVAAFRLSNFFLSTNFHSWNILHKQFQYIFLILEFPPTNYRRETHLQVASIC